MKGAASKGRFTRAVNLDVGMLTISVPPANAHPAISARLAECNLRAGLTAEGAPVEEQTQVSGLTFGLATVTVKDVLLADNGLKPSTPGSGNPTLPALHPYHRRLAWVAVLQPDIASSCPAQVLSSPPATTPPRPRLPGYQVLVIDANTGADGFVYAASANENCIDGISPPSVSAGVEEVSLPWTLVSRDPGGYSAAITVAVRSCDGKGDVGNAFNVSRGGTGHVMTDVLRPFNGCGASHVRPFALHAATVTSTLPPSLIHGPVGAVDTAG